MRHNTGVKSKNFVPLSLISGLQNVLEPSYGKGLSTDSQFVEQIDRHESEVELNEPLLGQNESLLKYAKP